MHTNLVGLGVVDGLRNYLGTSFFLYVCVRVCVFARASVSSLQFSNFSFSSSEDDDDDDDEED